MTPASDVPRHFDRLGPFESYFREGIPMLMYHAIESPPWRTKYPGLFYPPVNLARHLRELRAAGFRSCHPSEVMAVQSTAEPRICLTFDDGFANLHESAMELMRELGFSATVYLVAERIGATNLWDKSVGVAQRPLMNQTQIKEWLGAGHRIGAHTCTHVHLPQLSAAPAKAEILTSKLILEDRFGVAVEDFAYPYGERTDRDEDLVRQAGYITACTTRFGLNNARTAPFTLRRVTVRRPVWSWKTLRAWWARRRSAQA
jgi:peptidoglycan/xylan/chitin deacetylase (PgdA/CDA1 family)